MKFLLSVDYLRGSKQIDPEKNREPGRNPKELYEEVEICGE